MWILGLFLVFCWIIGKDEKPSKHLMRDIERDIFISDVISGKRKL